jgi:hypothetical protein
VITAISLGHPTTVAAEHWLREFVDMYGEPDELVACTHFAKAPHPHVAVSLAAATLPAGALPATPPRYAEAAGQAAVAHAARRSGRAARFPGAAALVGALTVDELLARSAIEQVTLLGGGSPAAGTVVDTRGFVRPEWRDGRLTLIAAPAGPGRIAPFEVPDPTPCCADHR